MELMTKYQYTYFIYPYLIEESQYKKYLCSLLKNNKCKLRFSNNQKDIHLYTYFLPNIRDFMFWSFGLGDKEIKEFNKLDTTMKSTILAERESGPGCDLPHHEYDSFHLRPLHHLLYHFKEDVVLSMERPVDCI